MRSEEGEERTESEKGSGYRSVRSVSQSGGLLTSDLALRLGYTAGTECLSCGVFVWEF